MALIFSTFPALRRAAPRLSREFFVCRQCLQKPLSSPLSDKIKSKKPSPSSQAPPHERIHAAPHNKQAKSSRWQLPTPLEGLSKSISNSVTILNTKAIPNSKTTGRARSFPEISDKVVAYWLLGSAASVFGIVVFGGLTRLTESGYEPHNRSEAMPTYFFVG